jgi:hypothetical protein
MSNRWLLNVGPLKLHLALFALVPLAAFGGEWAGAAAALGLVVLAHELGHAVLARIFGARITSLTLAPVGGVCRWEGDVSPMQRVAIAWGGALAQAVLFAVTLTALAAFGFPERAFVNGAAMVLALLNPVLLFVSLLPLEAFDGHGALKLFGMLRARRQLKRLEGTPTWVDDSMVIDEEEDDVDTRELEVPELCDTAEYELHQTAEYEYTHEELYGPELEEPPPSHKPEYAVASYWAQPVDDDQLFQREAEG